MNVCFRVGDILVLLRNSIEFHYLIKDVDTYASMLLLQYLDDTESGSFRPPFKAHFSDIDHYFVRGEGYVESCYPAIEEILL